MRGNKGGKRCEETKKEGDAMERETRHGGDTGQGGRQEREKPRTCSTNLPMPLCVMPRPPKSCTASAAVACSQRVLYIFKNAICLPSARAHTGRTAHTEQGGSGSATGGQRVRRGRRGEKMGQTDAPCELVRLLLVRLPARGNVSDR